jgi:hypothetical protein
MHLFSPCFSLILNSCLQVMTFLDPPRPDTKHTIEQARIFGVEVLCFPHLTCFHYQASSPARHPICFPFSSLLSLFRQISRPLSFAHALTLNTYSETPVQVKMITGDNKTIAVETARVLGMGTLIQAKLAHTVVEFCWVCEQNARLSARAHLLATCCKYSKLVN